MHNRAVVKEGRGKRSSSIIAPRAKGGTQLGETDEEGVANERKVPRTDTYIGRLCCGASWNVVGGWQLLGLGMCMRKAERDIE